VEDSAEKIAKRAFMLLKDANCDKCKFYHEFSGIMGLNCILKDRGIVTINNVVLNERGIVEHCEKFRKRKN
jgi:hypothetical protein